jgi:hypothetical protein
MTERPPQDRPWPTGPPGAVEARDEQTPGPVVAMTVRTVEVVVARTTIGEGTPSDPARMVCQLHDLDGTLIAIWDPSRGGQVWSTLAALVDRP